METLNFMWRQKRETSVIFIERESSSARNEQSERYICKCERKIENKRESQDIKKKKTVVKNSRL